MLAHEDRRPPAELQRLARYQRWVIAIVVTQLALWLGWVVLNGPSPMDLDTGFALTLTVVLGVGGAAYTFLLYWTIRDPLTAAVMALASVPPFLGLLTLTVANGAVTRVLRENGVEVGLFGAGRDAIEPEFAWIDEDADW